MLARAGIVADRRPVSVFRSTAPVPDTRVVTVDEVEWVADRVKATDDASAELAAAAPSAPRAEPGVPGCDPMAPPKAAAPKATAAIRAVAMVAMATRRAPPAEGAGFSTGPRGPAGGCSTVDSAPGVSTAARCSGGRTINAVAVVVPVSAWSTDPGGVLATNTPLRYSTDSPICAPSSCPCGGHNAQEAGNTAPGPVCPIAIVDKGGPELSSGGRGGWVRRPATYARRAAIRFGAPVPC